MAGNNGVQATGDAASFGKVSGIAPRARLAVYKACWVTPGVAERLLQLGRHDGRDRPGRRRRRRRDQLLDLGHDDRVHELGRGVVPVRRGRGRVRQRLGRQQRPDRHARSRTRARGSRRPPRARTTATARARSTIDGTTYNGASSAARPRPAAGGLRRSDPRRAADARPVRSPRSDDAPVLHRLLDAAVAGQDRRLRARRQRPHRQEPRGPERGRRRDDHGQRDAELGQRRPALRPVDPPGGHGCSARSRPRRRPARRPRSRRARSSTTRMRRSRRRSRRAARSRPVAATS